MSKNLFSETTNCIVPKLDKNDHLIIPYKVFVFLRGSKVQYGHKCRTKL